MAKDFLVTITGDRAAEWQQVFGTTTVNVQTPLPQWADLPGKGRAKIFLLDLGLITPEQRQRLIEHISQKWNIPPDQVEADIEAQGVPILDEDCYVTVLNPHKWFSSDDVEENDDDDYDDDDSDGYDQDPYFYDYEEDL